MKRNHKEIEAIIDNVAARIREEEPSVEMVTGAADRVWARLAAESAVSAAGQPAAEEMLTVEHIRGCADFQSLIPAYLKHQLSDARRLLLEDHTQECIPCRKALKEARSGRTSVPATTNATARKSAHKAQQPVWKWAIAATLLVGFTFAAYTLYQRYTYSYGVAGTVDIAQGTVYKVTDTDSRPLAVGEKIERGERIRTAKDASAVVRLNDGSLVEMRERSEFYVSENSHGTTLNLARGNVIVEAAKQHDRHLYVATDDALVSVTGTIFSVNSATKGSRVSVIEGEVHVDHQGEDRVLHPGDQTTTNASLESVAIKDEVSWSRNSARYATLMTQLAALRKDLNTKVQRPGVRYSTHLLDLMPAGTVLYAALPNLTGTIAESHKIMQDRIQQNPALREWWQRENGREGANLNRIMDRVREFGKYLGSEIAVGAQLGAKGEPENPLVIGELTDANGFRPFLEQQLAQLKAQEKNGPSVRIIDDPATATQASAAASAPELLIWIQGDIFAAAPKLAQLQQLAATLKAPGTNQFTQSPFYARISDTYREGAGLIVAADLERIVPQLISEDAKQNGGRERAEVFSELGLTNLKHFMVEQKETGGKTLSRAVLTFNETKR
ncbi:MAG TPA: FecR domain-containing protein, partial [Pyrinomonadaceae bacterium]